MQTNFKRRSFIKSTISLGTLFFVSGFKNIYGKELPEVFIIGDSISMGYTPFVKKILEKKANVVRPDGNCGPTERGVVRLDGWLGTKKYKVIYFNFGLHDMKHVDPVTRKDSAKAEDPFLADIPTYTANLGIIAKKLKATGAKVIFATTTPVPEISGAPLRDKDAPERYNEAARKVMKEHDIEIDDLYSYALPRLEKIQRAKNVHFTQEGSEVLAKRVTKTISKYL